MTTPIEYVIEKPRQPMPFYKVAMKAVLTMFGSRTQATDEVRPLDESAAGEKEPSHSGSAERFDWLLR